MQALWSVALGGVLVIAPWGDGWTIGGPGANSLAAQDRVDRILDQVSEREVVERLRRSGLSPTEVRERLEAEGHDPSIADRYLERMDDDAPGVEPDGRAPPDVVRGLRDIGVAVGTEDEERPPAVDTADFPPIDAQGPRVFGRELFRGDRSEFQPVITGPVDPGYRLGPGDEIELILTGEVELQHRLEVDRQGYVLIPQVGEVSVNGLTLEELRDRLYDRLGQAYSGISRGDGASTRFAVSLGRLRTNQVYVIGEVERPGAYQVSSVSTVFNALYSAGGPSEAGSFRSIRVRRGGELEREVDVYDYLLGGDTRDDIRLEQGDIVFVPPAGTQASVQGELRSEASSSRRNDPQAYLENLERRAEEAERELADFLEEHSDEEIRESLALSLRVERLRNRLDVRHETLLEAERRAGREIVLRDIHGAARTIFELNDGEDLSDLLDFAGGFRAEAFTGRVQIDRILPPEERTPERQRALVDVSLEELTDAGSTVDVRDGDRVTVFPVSDERRNRVVAQGQVHRPGEYEFQEGMTVQDLIDRADGLRPDAHMVTAHVTRRNWRDGTRELVRVALDEEGQGEPADQVELRDLDELMVFGREELFTPRSVRISGVVREPGEYDLADGMTVQDLILAAGGFEPGAQQFEAEVARMSDAAERTFEIADVERVPLAVGLVRADGTPAPGEEGDVEPPASNPQAVEEFERAMAQRTEVDEFSLQDGDHVFIRELPGYEPVETVELSGEVLYNGDYALEHRTETVSSLVARAGGLSDQAYLPGARILREELPVSVDLEAALDDPGGSEDMVLQPGDRLEVPRFDPTVVVTGAVRFETRVRYRDGFNLQDYLDQAGGVGDAGHRRRVSVEYPDGERDVSSRRLGLFTSDPDVEPGSVIHVPERPPEDETDWGDVISTSVSAISTAATLIVALSRL